MRSGAVPALRNKNGSAVARRRGSAYVEALLVCSLLSFLWLCALCLGRLYGMKLTSLTGAREAAWRATASPCGPRGDEYARAIDALVQAPDLPHGRAVLQVMARMSHRDRAQQSTVSRSQRLALFDREREVSVETTTRFVCNEAVHASAPSSTTGQRFVSELLRGVRP